MARISTQITLRELEPAELPALFPLIALLSPWVSKATFAKRLKAMQPLGYRAVGVFAGKKLIGASGFWIRTRFWCGRELDIDNFIVHPDQRGQKIGEALVQWLEQKAIEEKCELIVLDTYADSFLAHRFYQRAGFASTGFHYTKVPGSLVPFSKSNLMKKKA